MSEENIKKVSVKEFKAMIHGMDLLGGDDWAPNAEQWKRIRAMIGNLEDEPAASAAAVTYQPPTHVAETLPAPRAQTNAPPSNNPLENDSPEFFAPAPPSSIPSGPVAMGQSSSGLAPARQPQPAPKPQVNENGAIKTPDIDTSNGYNSSFV